MGARHPNVTNLDEVVFQAGPSHGTRFGSRMKPLAASSGGKAIGCTFYEIAPGKRAFPLHAHLVNEEAIYVLEGEATMRIGEGEVPVRAGDYVVFRPGPAEAHQLVNTSSAPVRYLCLSTTRAQDVALYPDSGKVMVRSLHPEPMRLLFQRSDALAATSYFDGEESE
jgi:uncharacterized cupin superfamily protein